MFAIYEITLIITFFMLDILKFLNLYKDRDLHLIVVFIVLDAIKINFVKFASILINFGRKV